MPRTVDKSLNILCFPFTSLPNISHNFKNLGSHSNSDNFTRLELAQSAKVDTAYKKLKKPLLICFYNLTQALKIN